MERNLEEIKRHSISGVLRSNGFKSSKVGDKRYFLSPFSGERQPSLVVYPDNTFYCYSTGVGGDVIHFVRHLNRCGFMEAIRYIEESSISIIPKDRLYKTIKKDFDPKRYITTVEEEVRSISRYGLSRGIFRNYLNGVFMRKDNNEYNWTRYPSLMFLYRDYNLDIVGAKFRYAGKEKYFSTRGSSGFYICENIIGQDPIVFISEGETSSNSLYEYLCINGINSVVISIGSVNNIPEDIPIKYRGFSNRFIVIDYDGDEDMYNKRIDRLSHLSGKDIKIPCDKGDDINSLWVKNYKMLNIIKEKINEY